MKLDPITHKLFIVGHKSCLIFDTLVRMKEEISPNGIDLKIDFLVKSRIYQCSCCPWCAIDVVSAKEVSVAEIFIVYLLVRIFMDFR